MIVFTIGDWWCGLSTTISSLIFARIITAFSHASFFGVSSVYASELAPPDRRASAVSAVSLDGGNILTPHDKALKELGYSRNVALSVATFLIVPEIVAKSNFVALVPKRLVSGRTGLKIVSPPMSSKGFSVGMVWHERTHNHRAHRWVRDVINQMMLP